MKAQPHIVDMEDLPEYPLNGSVRLDSHWFITWERRRWLNSDMRLKATPECRALYFDLICICYDQSPLGTLPRDYDVLSRLLMVDRVHFEALAALEYGPLHKWRPCRCGDEIRLYHPFVMSTLTEAISRKEDNRARMEAANTHKRLQRLRATLAGYEVKLAENDAAVRWIDEWLTREGCEYRSATWVERGIRAWTNHQFDLAGQGRRA